MPALPAPRAEGPGCTRRVKQQAAHSSRRRAAAGGAQQQAAQHWNRQGAGGPPAQAGLAGILAGKVSIATDGAGAAQGLVMHAQAAAAPQAQRALRGGRAEGRQAGGCTVWQRGAAAAGRGGQVVVGVLRPVQAHGAGGRRRRRAGAPPVQLLRRGGRVGGGGCRRLCRRLHGRLVPAAAAAAFATFLPAFSIQVLEVLLQGGGGRAAGKQSSQQGQRLRTGQRSSSWGDGSKCWDPCASCLPRPIPALALGLWFEGLRSFSIRHCTTDPPAGAQGCQ